MIYGNPVLSRFSVEIAIAERCLLELLPQTLSTARSSVVQHRLINEAATLPRLCEAIKSENRTLRQYNIDSFCHSGRLANKSIHILYTQSVYVNVLKGLKNIHGNVSTLLLRPTKRIPTVSMRNLVVPCRNLTFGAGTPGAYPPTVRIRVGLLHSLQCPGCPSTARNVQGRSPRISLY